MRRWSSSGEAWGRLAGSSEKASQVGGKFWNGRVHAKIAELSERTQAAPVALSSEDISTSRVASLGSRSVRLTKVARLRKDCQVGAGGMHFEQKVTKVAKGGNAAMGSGMVPVRVTRLTGERYGQHIHYIGKEITENNHKLVEQFGGSLGGLAGFAEKASQVAGSFGTDECTRKSRN